jgi:exopolysaccharide biosynthesis polyprenyl glycosylphosphotransferase
MNGKSMTTTSLTHLRSTGNDAHAAPGGDWGMSSAASPLPAASGLEAWRSRDSVNRKLLAVADVVAAYSALVLASIVVRGESVPIHPVVLLLAPFVVLVSKAAGVYDRDQHLLHKTTLEEAPTILQLATFYGLAVWVAEWRLIGYSLAPFQFLGLLAAVFLLLILSRSLARGVARTLTSPERCVVLGDAADRARIAKKLAESRSVKATVVGFVALYGDDRPTPGVSSAYDSQLSSLRSVVARQHADRVIIAPSGDDQEKMLHAIRVVTTLGVKVTVLPRLLEVVGSSSVFDNVDGLTMIGLRQYGISQSSQTLKRSMDITVSSVALVFLSPLFLLLAALIKLDSRGPVLFRQRRIGRNGELFEMLKFRSMVQNAEELKHDLHSQNEVQGGLFKIQGDPRITRFGRVLRQTSLDELPQLINVLTGSMSLVGPRPLVPDEDALIEGWQRRRLVVAPGMTGQWQIFGSSRVPMNEMVKIDYLYAANWSLWLDLKILLRTLPHVMGRRGL